MGISNVHPHMLTQQLLRQQKRVHDTAMSTLMAVSSESLLERLYVYTLTAPREPVETAAWSRVLPLMHL